MFVYAQPNRRARHEAAMNERIAELREAGYELDEAREIAEGEDADYGDVLDDDKPGFKDDDEPIIDPADA
jgi:hypothetical protein